MITLQLGRLSYTVLPTAQLSQKLITKTHLGVVCTYGGGGAAVSCQMFLHVSFLTSFNWLLREQHKLRSRFLSLFLVCVSPVTLESRSPLLLGRCSLQLCKSCAGANMVCSLAERVFILEHYFVPKSFAAVREAFSNAYPDKEVPKQTAVHWVVTKFRDAGSVCLWQVLIERQNSWNYGRTDFKQCISCNDGIRLQEFNIAICFVKGFMCSSKDCVLNGTPCIALTVQYTQYRTLDSRIFRDFSYPVNFRERVAICKT
jgi:hypothetical protein